MGKHDEMTRYAFISHMEDYMKKLLKDPFKADTDEFLKGHGLDGPVALKMLLKRSNPDDEMSAVLIRSEKIKDNGQDENGKRNPDTFTVKYKIPRKDYTKKMRNLYINLFESNIIDGCPINEMNANHFPELSKIEKQKKGYANLKGDVIYSFGKNGHGLTDEITKIGKEIEKLSKTNNVFLRDSSFDGCDDLYVLSFDIHPITKKDEEVYWPVNKYIMKNLHKLYNKKGDKITWEDESLIYDKGIEKLKSLGMDDAAKYAKRDKEKMRKLRAEQAKGKTSYEIGEEHPELFAINEEGEGGGAAPMGATSTFGMTPQGNALGDVTPKAAFGKKKKNEESDVIRRKTLYLTEEQIQYIKEATAGDFSADGNGSGLACPMGGKVNKGSKDPFYREANNHKNICGNGSVPPTNESKIHIKKENEGKFTETKKRTGKSTEELTHSKNPLTRKRAVFAQNAAKWNHKKGK